MSLSVCLSLTEQVSLINLMSMESDIFADPGVHDSTGIRIQSLNSGVARLHEARAVEQRTTLLAFGVRPVIGDN